MNRAELQQLADLRIAEASVLLTLPTPMPDGAYYLAGYAVECALKACIAKLNNQDDWPEKSFVTNCHTHDLSKLLALAGLEAAFKADSAADPDLQRNWTVVSDWTEQGRYERHSLAKTQQMIDAITDPVNGVLRWIKSRW